MPPSGALPRGSGREAVAPQSGQAGFEPLVGMTPSEPNKCIK
jgi:hypothetical protein